MRSSIDRDKRSEGTKAGLEVKDRNIQGIAIHNAQLMLFTPVKLVSGLAFLSDLTPEIT